MPEPPTGTVTFLFTDLEGSTRLWEEHPEEMKAALVRHDALLRTAVEGHAGFVVKTTGDGVYAAFATAEDAVRATLAAQLALRDEAWPEPIGALRVRMGLHTGSAELHDGDYHGSAANRAARVMAVAHGGQVLCSQATADLVRDALAEGMGLVDLGEHRLRDLSRAERVFQVSAVGLPSEFGPLRSLDTLPGNLPVQLSSFVGRDHEIARIAEAFHDARLVTITGVGGVGKTRLAVQVAAELLPTYEHGAWLCELAAATDGETMAQVVAATLGVRLRPGLSLEDSIVEFVGTRCLLVVLDNCEHLRAAAGGLAARLLRRCQKVRILATSREGLAVDGEHVWPLRSLPLPRESSIDAVGRSDAVRLFLERARGANPAFVLDTGNAHAVAEVCARLDGIPLAIELAAARVAVLAPSEIASRLDERFRLLTGGRRSAAERHQTLRATVAWSYALLDDRERLVFDRLGVFAGSFDAAAAEAVTAGGGIESWDVFDALSGLVAKSMVVTAERDGDGGSTRYVMLETLRHYALERLDAGGDADTWRRRHAEHYAGRAEEIGRGLAGSDDRGWRPLVRAELDNLRAAVTWALDARGADDLELALRIIAALAYEAFNDREAGIGLWAERAVDQAQASRPDLRAAVLAAAAWEAWGRGDLDAMHDLAFDSVRDRIPPDSPAGVWGYDALAASVGERGDVAGAMAIFEEAHDALDTIGGDPLGHSLLHNGAAALSLIAGDFDRGLAEAREGVRLAREAGNSVGLADALWIFGWALSVADPEAAIAAIDESVELNRAGTVGFALGMQAYLRFRFGDPIGSLEALRRALALARDTGVQGILATSLEHAVDILAPLGHPELAAVFIGALEHGVVSSLAFTIAGPQPVDLRRAMEEVRAALEPASYRRLDALGSTMSFEELVEYARHEIERIITEARDG